MTNKHLLTLVSSILTATIALGGLQSRATRSELRDRLGRMEGDPDLLRELCVVGRGTAA